MNSIFVDPNDTVEITLHYRKNKDGAIEILDQASEGTESLTLNCQRPSFATSQQVVAASMIIGQDGQQQLNFMKLQNTLLYALAKSWDVKDDKGNVIPVTVDTISSLRSEIARALVNLVIDKIGIGI